MRNNAFCLIGGKIYVFKIIISANDWWVSPINRSFVIVRSTLSETAVYQCPLWQAFLLLLFKCSRVYVVHCYLSKQILGPYKAIIFPSSDRLVRRHPIRVAESRAESCERSGNRTVYEYTVHCTDTWIRIHRSTATLHNPATVRVPTSAMWSKGSFFSGLWLIAMARIISGNDRAGRNLGHRRSLNLVSTLVINAEGKVRKKDTKLAQDDPRHCPPPGRIVIGQLVNILGPETLSTNVDPFPGSCLRCSAINISVPTTKERGGAWVARGRCRRQSS